MASAAVANGRIPTRARDNVEQLRADLEVDRALSEGQVLRHYGISLASLEGFARAEAYLAVTRGSYRHQRTNFVVCPARLRQTTGPSLRHLAGVAEMRRLLGAAPEDWESVAEARHRLYIPDAVWTTPDGTVAIEYDVGSYAPQQVITKARTFNSYTRQIWGAPTLARSRHLDHLLSAGGLRASAVTAVWC
jgi:hypothetical protein